MFVDIAVVLAGTESSILFFDEEERGRLWRVGQVDFSQGKVFV